MDFVTPIIEVVKSIWVPLARQISYIKNLEENIEALEKKKENLTCLENDISTDVDKAQRQGRNPKHEVHNWLKNVNQVKDQVSIIERENKRCLSGCLPNYYSHRKLSKRTLKLIVEVDDLIKRKGLFVGDVATDPPAPIARMLPTTSFRGTTAEKTFQEILNCLNDNKIRRIGIYGMGGVGKTTIMKKINNHLKDAKLFDMVIWVIVSKDLNLKKLQSDIALQIELNLSEDHGIDIRSFQLHEALLRKKNYLLILDDLWSLLLLEDVGIPKPDVKNGCKLVLTTRSQIVCGRMETQIDIQVKALSQEEAWSLFQEKIGTNAFLDLNVQDVATQVAKECAGLPLAIITVAGALKNTNEIGEWRDALYQLKNSHMTEIEGMEEEVLKPLKFSYDRLSNDKMKSCFLYCSLYSEDRSIEENELIERWIWEGLIGVMENRQAEFDHGQSLLNKLKRACMLESGDFLDSVKMHDLMRDMAIGITRHNRSFIVKAGMGLENADKEWEEDVERISLMNNKIKMLSVQPRCPKLLTLLLNDNPISEIIPHSFFENMHGLRVLDLSRTKIKTMPDSVSDLENLYGLLLNNCPSLEKVPSLAKLKKLRKLDLTDTCIEELPESLSDLENLQELLLYGCEKLKSVPSLAKLKELRKLDLSRTCIEELPESLSDLENLQELLLYSCEKLKSVPSLAKLKELRELVLSSTCIEELPESLSDLENLQELLLYNCEKLKSVPSLAKLKELRKLDLSYTCIGELPESLSDLENLQELFLYNCVKLKSVPSLAKLKELRKLVLSSTCIEELPESLSDMENLQELLLYKCEKLKTVPSLAKLKELRKLVLSSTCIEELPESLSDMENLQELLLYKCEKLKSVPSLAKLKELRKLNLSKTCIEELPESLSDLENLQELLLYGCKKLKSVPSLAKLKELRKLDLANTCIEELPESLSDLENLQELLLYDCEKLKSVPSLAKLKELRKLVLSKTCIEELPKGIERLVALDALYLDDTKKLKRVPMGILPKLSLLEIFSMKGSSCLCTSNEAEMMEGRIGIKDVAGLTRLNSVWLDFVDLASFSYYVKPLQKERMKLGLRVVKSSTQSTSSEDEDDSFLLKLDTTGYAQHHSNELILLRECHDIIRMSDFLTDSGLMELKIRDVGIHSCHGMECLVVAEDNNNFLLSEVVKLSICNLPNLGAVYRGTVVHETFANLREIKVSTCPKLRKLFSLRLLESLQNLVSIKVEDCDMMEELVAGEDDEISEGADNNDIVITLPCLVTLELSRLPALKSICSKALVCNSLEEIEIIQCPHLKKIALCINEPPSGFKGRLKGNREWWDALEWNDLNTKALLEPLFKDEDASTDEEAPKAESS